MSPAGPRRSDALADLVEVMDRLRSPGGCPWDAEQTHESLVPYAVEEVFEVVEAVETGDRVALREELGDLLLQVLFHARVAAEHPTEPFDLDDVAAGIAAKLRRRHPHVFAEAQVRDAAHVSARWDEIKRAEKQRASALDGIPAGLPALARAQAVLARARRAGLDTSAAGLDGPAAGLDAPVAGLDSPAGGLDTPAGGGDAPRPAEASSGPELGRSLLALVVQAQVAGVDAEGALRAAVRDLEASLRAAEPAPVRPTVDG